MTTSTCKSHLWLAQLHPFYGNFIDSGKGAVYYLGSSSRNHWIY